MTRHRGRGPLAEDTRPVVRAVAGALAAAVMAGTGLAWAIDSLTQPERPAPEQTVPARSPTPGGTP